MSTKAIKAAVALLVMMAMALDIQRAIPPLLAPLPGAMGPKVVVLTAKDMQHALAGGKHPERAQGKEVSTFWSTMTPKDKGFPGELVAHYTQTPHPHGWVQYTLREDRPRLPNLSQATVTLTPLPQGSPPQACPPQAGGFQCGSSPWMLLGPRADVRVEEKPSRCIWAHPMTGHVVEVRYPEVGLPPGSALFLHTALDDRAVDGQGAPVELSVAFQGGVTQVRHLDQRGWRTAKVGQGGGAQGPLVLTITTPHDGRRHFCYRFDTAPAAGAGR